MDRAGEETFIMNVFRTIDRSQFMFDFLVTEDREGEYDREINELGGIVRHIQMIKHGGSLKRFKNFILLYRYLRPLHKNYTTFHIHTQHAMDAMLDAMAAKLAGFRTVVVHSHSTSTLHHVRAHHICRPFLNYLPIVRLACGKKAGQWLYGENGKFEIINNGIVTDKFLFNPEVRTEIRQKEGWGKETIIGHVGNFTHPKNHSFLLDIFAHFLVYQPDSLLVMAGKGELMDPIKAKADYLCICDHVIFLGSRSDVNRLYSAFDALLFPSLFEGLPVTLVEAQAADLPCLISDSITTETDINPNLKRMSLNKSANEWAMELDRLLSEKGRIDRSEKIIESGYDIEITSKRLSEIYQ